MQLRMIGLGRMGASMAQRLMKGGHVCVGHDVHVEAARKTFKTIPVGTSVTWHYRSAIGHGTVVGVHKMGTTADNTMYDVEQHDHHPGEPAIVHHTGKALSTA